MNYHFREFEEGDYDAVITLWKLSGIKISLSDQRDELFKLVFKDQNKCYILEERNKNIIGVMICGYDGRRGYIHHVAIHPDYQNQGLGRLLMDHGMKHFQKLNTVKVHLFVETKNLEVIDFYKKLGWSVRDDIVMMTKTLRQNDQ